MKKLSQTYLILIIVLGSITITTVLADTVTITTYPYTIRDGSSNPRFVITSSGNVGIGTANPLTKLDLGANPSIFLEGNTNQWGFTVNSTDLGSGNVPLIITSRGGGVNNEVVRITHVGNVGIGTTSPTQKLDVTGNIRLTGNIVSPNDICIGTC